MAVYALLFLGTSSLCFACPWCWQSMLCCSLVLSLLLVYVWLVSGPVSLWFASLGYLQSTLCLSRTSISLQVSGRGVLQLWLTDIELQNNSIVLTNMYGAQEGSSGWFYNNHPPHFQKMNVGNIHFLLILSRTVGSESFREYLAMMVLTQSTIRMFMAIDFMLVQLYHVFRGWLLHYSQQVSLE